MAKTVRDTLQRLGRFAGRPGLIYLCSRVGVLLVVLAVVIDASEGLGHGLTAWDSHWYLAAAKGYPHTILSGRGNVAQSSLGFFPALPIVIKAVHLVLGTDYTRSGLLATFALGITAAVAVWRLLQETEGRDRADRGTALLLFSPGAFVLSLVYSEGLLITAVAICLIALRHRRWVVAGLFAAVATATDPIGLAVVLPCLFAAREAIWKSKERDLTSLAAPLLAPMGTIGFFSFLWAWTGTPFAWFVTQRRGWQGGPPASSIPKVFVDIAQHGFVNPNSVIKAASFLVCAGLLVAFLKMKPGILLSSYVVGALFFAAMSPVIGWTPRVALRAFPLIALVGARIPERWFPLVLATTALVTAAVTAVSLGNAHIPFTP